MVSGRPVSSSISSEVLKTLVLSVSVSSRSSSKSLGLRGLDAIVDPDGAACVRDGIAAILGDPEQLVAASQRIATHLDDIQTGRNSAGLLAIVLGSIDGRGCVSVLKLEREQGLRFHIDVDEQGRKVVDLDDLLAEVGPQRVVEGDRSVGEHERLVLVATARDVVHHGAGDLKAVQVHFGSLSEMGS